VRLSPAAPSLSPHLTAPSPVTPVHPPPPPVCTVCVGQGNHSAGKRAVLGPVLRKHCDEEGWNYTVVRNPLYSPSDPYLPLPRSMA